MAISSNSKWNYGTILTPDKMNNIECSLDQIVMGAIDKRTEFDGNSIVEYFGDVITIDQVNYQNKKTTQFLSDGSIEEIYDLYFVSGENNNINYLKKSYKKTTNFLDNGSIEEILEEVIE